MKKKADTNIRHLLILHAGVFIFALSAVLSKFAAGEEAFSAKFFLFYALSLFLLFIYAVIWQQALRFFKLGTAYANRASAGIWSLVFGALIFNESIKPQHILGVAVIIAGVIMMVNGDE